MEGDVVPTFKSSLIGIKPFADVRFISIFYQHQGGVTTYHQNDVKIKYFAPPIIKGVRDKAGLWILPLTNNNTHYEDLLNTTRREHLYLAHNTSIA